MSALSGWGATMLPASGVPPPVVPVRVVVPALLVLPPCCLPLLHVHAPSMDAPTSAPIRNHSRKETSSPEGYSGGRAAGRLAGAASEAAWPRIRGPSRVPVGVGDQPRRRRA